MLQVKYKAPMLRSFLIAIFLFLLSFTTLSAQAGIVEVCPGVGIQARPAVFEPGGIIITAFDGENMWAYDIERATRFPLPQTRPCTSNCRLSPDANWLSYLDPETLIFTKMRLDGTQRTPLASSAADVQWWSADTLLIWTPDHRALLRSEADSSAPPQTLPVRGVRSIQPGGQWALLIENGEDNFMRFMVNLETRDQAHSQKIQLAEDRPFFNAAAWSPDGRLLAYVGRSAFDNNANSTGGEIFLAAPGSAIPQQATFLFNTYGAVRINGRAPGELRWSPDSRLIAFWVIELLGPDPAANTGTAVLHLLDVTTFAVRRYCGFSTTAHSPNPPRLIWSPDSTHIAFAGEVPADGKGTLLLALDLETGIFTELSAGIFPVLGMPDVAAWGHAP